MALVMNGLHCLEEERRKKKKKTGPGSPQRINMNTLEDLLRMLKSPMHAPLRPSEMSPTYLMDKPLGEASNWIKVVQGGLE